MGAINGLLVEVARIDSFIATLGTGTVLYALALWHTGGRQVVAMLPQGFLSLNGTLVFGLPITGYYVVALAAVLWFVLEYMPLGRYMYAIGANPKAAALNGIPVERYTMLAFTLSGLLTAAAGVLLASKLRIGQASVGLEFLLPALGRRLPGLHDHQAGSGQHLGNAVRRRDPGGRHLWNPAARRFVLGRTPVQRRNAVDCHRHCGLCPAQACGRWPCDPA